MRASDFDFELPEALIAQFPPERRGASRLLYLNAPAGELRDAGFDAFCSFVGPGDLLVFNDTRVIKARLMAAKETGGKVEMLVERILNEGQVLAQLRASHQPRPGSRLRLPGGREARVVERQGEFHRLAWDLEEAAETYLERHGSVPLPPYIRRPADAGDAFRYQTVYAKHPGAVAAPTAGLHFDSSMLDRVRAAGADLAYLTLHVGAGTFQPVRAEDLRRHRMHAERYCIPPDTARRIQQTQTQGGRILAVGTTVLRALESAAEGRGVQAGEGETRLFITPGYRFRVVDRLLTNFHLPRSTLLMLVCAFGGSEAVRKAYRHAVAECYRFFSYGDAMLIERS